MVPKSLGIVGSQIEIEQIFSVASVIINLRWSKLDIEDLSWLIFMIKNWPNDTHDGCGGPFKPKDVAEFLASQAGLIKEHKKMLEQHDLFEWASSLDTI